MLLEGVLIGHDDLMLLGPRLAEGGGGVLYDGEGPQVHLLLLMGGEAVDCGVPKGDEVGGVGVGEARGRDED